MTIKANKKENIGLAIMALVVGLMLLFVAALALSSAFDPAEEAPIAAAIASVVCALCAVFFLWGTAYFLREAKEGKPLIEITDTYFYDHSDMIKLLFLNRTDADMMQGMNEFCRSFLELRKKEMPTPDMDEDTVKAIIALVGGGGHCLLRQWILGDIHKTPKEIAAILCNVIHWPTYKDLN